MNILRKTIVVICSFVFIISVFLFCSIESQGKDKLSEKLKPRQIWLYTSKDPFYKLQMYSLVIDTATVDNTLYVKYLWREPGKSPIYTDSKVGWIFMSGSVLIGNATHQDSVMFGLIK